MKRLIALGAALLAALTMAVPAWGDCQVTRLVWYCTSTSPEYCTQSEIFTSTYTFSVQSATIPDSPTPWLDTCMYYIPTGTFLACHAQQWVGGNTVTGYLVSHTGSNLVTTVDTNPQDYWGVAYWEDAYGNVLASTGYYPQSSCT